MVEQILRNLKSTSVVVLSYVLSQQSGFVDFMERKGVIYGVLIVTLDSDEITYKIYHLSSNELRELYAGLPVFNRVMCNFSISDDVVFYDKGVSNLEHDKETLQMFKGHVVEYPENRNTFWRFLHYCLQHDVKFYLEDSDRAMAVSQLRFSDSTPNILLSIADETGRFASKIVYSLDKSVPVKEIFLESPSVPEDLVPFLYRVGDSRYKVMPSMMEIPCIDQDDFSQVFNVQLLIGLLNCREYFKCMREAVEVVRFYIRMLNPKDVPETPKVDYTATAYSTNCEIDYSLDKPRINALKKAKDTETQEEFVKAVEELLGNPATADEFLQARMGKSVLEFAFTPTFKTILQAYKEGGLDVVLAYDAGIARRQCLYAIEVFKWKAAMAYFNEVPTCFGNAFTTQFGVLRLKLGEVV